MFIMFIMLIIFYILLILLGLFFIGNGIYVLMHERFQLGNALSLLTGIAIEISVAVSVFLHSININTYYWYTFTIVTIIAALLIFTIATVFINRRKVDKNVDFIIVLGSGLIDRITVSPLLVSRLEKAILEFKQSPTATLVLSGGQGDDEDISEAEAMKNYLVSRGIPESKLILEDKSTNTMENLTYTREILSQKNPNYKAYFITNNYHVLRGTIYAHKAKLNAKGVGSETARYFLIPAFLREFVALLVRYWWCFCLISLGLLICFLL